MLPFLERFRVKCAHRFLDLRPAVGRKKVLQRHTPPLFESGDPFLQAPCGIGEAGDPTEGEGKEEYGEEG
jgi:hypothetical protein